MEPLLLLLLCVPGLLATAAGYAVNRWWPLLLPAGALLALVGWQEPINEWMRSPECRPPGDCDPDLTGVPLILAQLALTGILVGGALGVLRRRAREVERG